MIISRFNKYVEKHGRVTYIVLGIVISLMFVIFVGSGNEIAGGCAGRKINTTVAKMYGKNIKFDEFMHAKRETDIASYMRYGMFLSQYSDEFLNRETFSRIRMIHEAQKQGFIKKVEDTEVAKTIQKLPWLQENGKFSLERFQNFKNGFLRSYSFTAKDFDDLIRHNIAIQNMLDEQTKNVTVDEKEIDEELTEYQLSYANIDLDIEASSAPTEKEINDFFTNRKAEIVPEQLRSAIIASYDTTSFAALPDVVPTEDEIKKNYEANKDKIYKGKTFDAAKPLITASLKNNKLRTYTRTQANTLLTNIKKEIANLDENAKIQKFTEMATAAKANVVTSGFFGDGSKIDGLAGEHVQLANAIRSLDKKGDIISNVVIDGTKYAFAMLADIKAGTLPDTLNDSISKKIKDMIITEKALAFYNEKVAPYKEAAKGSKSSYDIGSKQLDEIRNNNALSTDEKQARMIEFNNTMRETVNPFYRQEERSFGVVTFNPSKYEAGVTLTETDIEKGFEARKNDYEKVEVRISKLLVKAASTDTDDVKNAKKARADEAYKKLTEGSDFADIVKEYSEDEDTKDKGGDSGLVNINTLSPAIREQIAKMQVNQLSPVIGTEDGHVIFKLVEKTAPKKLEDVRGELVGILTKEAAKKAALVDAEALAQAVASSWNTAGHKADEKLNILKSCAADTKGEYEEFPMTRQYSYGAKGAAGDSTLMAALFKVTTEEPYTKAIEGKDAMYVACVNEIAEAYLAEAKDSMPTLKNIYKRYVANEAALAKANAEVTRINDALKAGTDFAKATESLKFKAASSKVTKENSQQFRELSIQNTALLIPELSKAAEKSVIAPLKGYSGYVLVYLESKTIPTGDEAKEAREGAKAHILSTKKNEILSNFLKRIEDESKTTDINPALAGRDVQ